MHCNIIWAPFHRNIKHHNHCCTNFINDLIAYARICHNGLKVVMEKQKHRFVCNRLSLHSPHANVMDSSYS